MTLAKLYAYCNSVMEPWDGPAAIAAYANDWVIAGLDRNGLRPMRYVVTDDGLVIAGSETGMVVVPEERIIERGRIGPGQMMGIDLKRGAMFTNERTESGACRKARLAANGPAAPSRWIRCAGPNGGKSPERMPSLECAAAR